MATSFHAKTRRVRVEMSFEMHLPLEAEVPDAQLEAIEAAALALAGPCHQLRHSQITIQTIEASAEASR